MPVRFFRAEDGARLAYRDEGEGLPVLALPGLTRTGRDFDYLVPHLTGVRLIRPDYRGRGDSDWTGADSYTVPQEARDALALLDHLGIARAAVLGTSRGGLIGMLLAATARDRLLGLCLNDVGPVLQRSGLERIFDYVGRNPAAKSLEDMAQRLPALMPGFAGVPASRWLEEARHHYVETPAGLRINYDPALRDAFLAAFDGPEIDLWPLFDATQGLPLALVRGANSDLLSHDTAIEMQCRQPGIILAEVPGRAHVPFLDEPESLAAIRGWLAAMRQDHPPAAQFPA
ncbi:alpha/beta fold hydrolase [Paracoccus sp. P2]|uniref:Alpha/beta fold hydrolase n=1 Tax=Paracoccus pantotrophus TaxID=82367 RepID=A0A7H9BNZ0_PARPN|nr:alpha/beta hydrolase [Paracoccus pantotrophus]MDF3855918.1 alpha/beta hydrolase [Paracoccus pantotrophus]QLH12922.1 alpha/beta fold hydrolase [Paracoccus pantotrophus]RDD93753.1 alpha/beta hydrolase [Paracoccus pantotrophus]WGR66533.1 alpha/beta fold hydrolase [Paracoccus pantotrophus]SFO86921.1 Pimeloyl-ACP methyl ester carboxylesterase [Paracoccus pantotrophus]